MKFLRRRNDLQGVIRVAKRLIIHSTSDSAWVSATDLMAGLMIIFMFIAISFMQHVSNIAEEWAEKKEEIYQALEKEFKNDLPKWNAEIIKESLTVRFKEPKVLFGVGSYELKERFEKILNEFFPRYINVLQSYSNDVAEIRIEGHTSSEWIDAKSDREAYSCNMRLSQDRTREVLIYCLDKVELSPKEYNWSRENIVAAGFSSSRVIKSNDEKEDKEASRRVEFRVRTNADEKLSLIFADKNM